MAKLRNILQLPPTPEKYDRQGVDSIFRQIINWAKELTALINGNLDYPDNIVTDPEASPLGSGTAGRITKFITTSTVGNATNTDTDVADAVTKKHTQGTDQKLDDGGVSEVTAAEVKSAVDDTHSHSNKTTLDATEEAFTTVLKAVYDALSGSGHTHYYEEHTITADDVTALAIPLTVSTYTMGNNSLQQWLKRTDEPPIPLTIVDDYWEISSTWLGYTAGVLIAGATIISRWQK